MEIETLFENLYEEMDLELENILEFWNTHTLDQHFEGFVGQIDQSGKIIAGATKSSVLNSRLLWTFSAAFNAIGSERLEKLADRAYQYVTKYFWDKDNGGLYWEVDHQGKPLNTRKQAYAQGFGIYAFSEYYKVSGNKESLGYAIQLFNLLEDHFRDNELGGYIEALDKEWKPMEDFRLSDKDANSPKSMNTHLHILEPYTNLYRVWPDERLKTSIKHVIEMFLDHIIDHNTGHFKLFFDMDWTCHHNIVSYGHSIEGAWLLREAALEIDAEDLMPRVEKAALGLVDAVRKEGMDDDYSLFNEIKDGHLDTDKHWWPQAEAMVGLFDAWEITGNTAYLEEVSKVWEFIKENVIDYDNGEWFGRLDCNGVPYDTEDKVGFWKCPYHNTRAMLEITRRVKEFID